MTWGEDKLLRKLIELEENVARNQFATLVTLERIFHLLEGKPTPTHLKFKELTMTQEGPGVTQVWTATLEPSGAAFPAGTTFTVVPSDPTVSVTVDPTGLIVTIVYPDTFVVGPEPFSVSWSTSDFTPFPSTSPSSLNATITPSQPPPTTPTPTSITFAQTS